MSNFVKNSMNFGAILGLILVLLFFTQYFLKLQTNQAFGFLQFAALIGIITWGTKHVRDTHLNGVITYSRALGSGVTISLYGSIIIAFMTYIFYKFIDTSALQAIYIEMENQFYKMGKSEAEIEMMLEASKKMMNPLFMSIGTIFGLTFWGFLFSLIIAAFVKRKSKNTFDNSINVN